MSDWSGGYVTGHEYLRSFRKEMAPSFLRCLMVLRQRRPLDLSKPFRYLDLGCASGFGCNLLAAANPQGEFIGIDFDPDQIVQARDMSAAIGITNVRFIEAGFADILDRPDEIGEVDVLACHGVYTWVSPQNRRAIVEIMRRHVATGGLVYLGYNAMPGWAPIAPLRHLILRLAEGRTPAGQGAAIGEARAFFELLREPERGCMHGNKPVARWLDNMQNKPLSYLAHEYLPEAATAVWHDEVARDVAPARLSYLGSGRLVENFDSLNIPAELRERVAKGDEQGLGETLRDIAVNQTFRMDVYTRGAPRIMPADAEACFNGMAVAATEPPGQPPAIKTGQGEMRLAETVATPVLELVAEGPTSIGALVDGAAKRGVDRSQARQVVTAMLAGGILSPLADLDPGDEAVAACDAFNREALKRARRGEVWPALASPLLGSGVALRAFEQRVLAGAAPEPVEPVEPVEPDGPEADGLHEDETQQVEARLKRLEAQRSCLQRLGVVSGQGPSAREAKAK